MNKSSSLIKKTKEVAAEVSDAARGAVKAVVRAAKSAIHPAKPKARKRSVVAKRPKISRSKATTQRRTRGAKRGVAGVAK